MKHRKTKGWLLLAAATVCIQTISAQAAPKPNILYLYADDLGWGSLSANTGSDTLTITPTIDSLVAGGINFRRAYGCMVCSPARSTQQTGFHQGHTWTDRNDTDAYKKAMRADDLTIGDMLNSAGYRVSYYGKWGYGAASTLVDPALQNLQTLPVNHGYTDLLAELHHVRAHTFFQPSLWFNNIDTHGTSTVLEYNDNVGGNHLEYADDLYAEAAETFVRAHANGSKPFCALVAFQVPHTPLGDVAEMADWFSDYDGIDTSTWPTDAKQYAAMVTRQDHHIADLLAALDDPNGDGNTSDSVRANTLVIFASDNGGQGGTPYDFFDTNGNLAGVKGSVQEGGIRVPTAFNWQGVIAPGQSTDHITCVSDMLPTLCDLAGVLPPMGIDGVSIAPLLTGTGQQRVRPWYTHENGSSTWSLIRPDGIKLRNTGALYNLADGSNTNYEATNLLADTGDPMYPTYLQWKNEMQAIVMAERVTEAYGFANTYHHWIGADGANASEAANWSDYAYVNAINSTTYISETGAPRERWNATLANIGATDQTAVLDADVSVLGIEIAGNPATDAEQILSIVPGITLTGRNEIRLSPLSTVKLNGGALASTRWVDLFAGATIQGPGTIDAILYNAGTLDITTNMLDGTTYTTNIIPGSGGDQTIQFNRFSNTDHSSPGSDGSYPATGWISTDGGATPNASAVYDVSTFIADNVVPPQPLAYTVTGLNIDGEGGDNDQVVINFSVSTDGQNLQTVWSGTEPQNAGWLSSGGTTLNANGEYVQFDFTSLSIDLNGGTGNGFGTFDGFSAVSFGSFTVAGEVGVANGLTQAIADGKELDLSDGGLDSNLQVIYDTTQGSVGGGYRPEGWSFQISTSGDPIPAVTNITTNVVSSAGVVVSQDYYQSDTALLDVPVVSTYTSLVVNGTATLDGRLECSLPTGFTASDGDRFTIISASSVTGTFSNPDGMLEKGGHPFQIQYAADNVELEKVAVTTAGTPHWWMDLYGLTNDTYEAEDLLDIDGDGLAAWEEYIAGTRPDMASSALVIAPESRPVEGGFIVLWPSVAGRTYALGSSTNLMESFQPLATGIPANPPENTYTDATEKVESFYRVQAERQ